MSTIDASGTLYIQQSGSDIQYSSDNSNWTTISSWPVYINNTTPAIDTILTVLFTTNITTSITNFEFNINNPYITFDGSYNGSVCTLEINAAIFPGIFITNSNHTITIKNFIVSGIGTMYSISPDFATDINSSPGFDPSINFCSLENCVNNKPLAGLGSMLARYPATNGTLFISGCTNNADIPISSGGICSRDAGRSNGTVNISNCINNGSIGETSGGICGEYAGINGNSFTIDSCINNGSNADGGICGRNFCWDRGTGYIVNCINNGSNCGGGICGSNAGGSYATLTIENCINNGSNCSGGICGLFGGSLNGNITITKCCNTANVILGAGGIVAGRFGENSTSGVHSITNCYCTAPTISGGGICAGFIGLESPAPIYITNCYSLGTITDRNAAGISGRNNAPIVNVFISNCYSYGTYDIEDNNGIANGPNTFTITNCYAANGTWTDASANLNLTGTPTSFYVDNPGTTWASTGTNTPYILSVFNSTIYDPSMVVQANYYSPNCISPEGLFQPSYDYNLLLVNNSTPTSNITIDANNGEITFAHIRRGATKAAEVLVSKGPAPYYNSYNLNSFIYSNVCFPAKTPIQTDQGLINIDEINSEIHTIRKKKILAVTKTITKDKHLICFEQDSFAKNVPSQKTVMSQNHEVLYKGKMMKAKNFVGLVDNVYMKKYKGEVLYNILMEEHDKMIVNNLVCETLDPKNRIAKLYMMLQQMTPERQKTFIKQFNEAQENEEEIKRNKCVSISKK